MGRDVDVAVPSLVGEECKLPGKAFLPLSRALQEELSLPLPAAAGAWGGTVSSSPVLFHTKHLEYHLPGCAAWAERCQLPL